MAKELSREDFVFAVPKYVKKEYTWCRKYFRITTCCKGSLWNAERISIGTDNDNKTDYDVNGAIDIANTGDILPSTCAEFNTAKMEFCQRVMDTCSPLDPEDIVKPQPWYKRMFDWMKYL